MNCGFNKSQSGSRVEGLTIVSSAAEALMSGLASSPPDLVER